MTRSLGLAVTIVLSLTSRVPAQPAIDHKSVDALVKDTLNRWNVPGLAVIIVHQDEVALMQGHGVRELGKKEPVTPDTVFALASLTKAFAATTLALLVDDGKAGWDDHVRKHLPAFRLNDTLADREVRLRDLLCHRTGLSRHERLWYRAPWSLDETVKRMAFLEPTHSFRVRYEYCNLGYIAAGQAIAKAAGMPWDEFTRKRLLEPLRMKNAVFTRKAVLALADHATPHQRAGGKVKPIDWYADDEQVRASGSLKASVRDLGNWLRLNLNGGVIDGKRIVSAETLAEMHTPQVVAPIEGGFAQLAGTTQQSYGLGWRILDYRGQRLIEHNGSADGFRSRLALLPKQKMGFVLLANLDEAAAVQALGNWLLDELLGVEKKDWHAFYRKARDAEMKTQAARVETGLASRKKGTKPSREQSAYAGVYRDRAYGEATVKHDEGKGLTLVWSSLQVPLEHFHYDTFLLGGVDRLESDLVRFELDRDGNVKTMQLLGRTFERGR